MAFPSENQSNRSQKTIPAGGSEDAPGQPGTNDQMVKNFRDQIHALGVLWIIIGSLAGASTALVLQENPDLTGRIGGGYQALVIVTAFMGVFWIVLGVLSCLKNIWAVYVGLVLSYLSLLSQLWAAYVGLVLSDVSLSSLLRNENVWGILILVIVIFQAHRVISWANQMRAASIPLTAKPQ